MVVLGLGVGHTQLETQALPPLRAQISSQAVVQQNGSAAQTHCRQDTSSQLGPSWAEQQAPPAVGVGVGLGGVPVGVIVIVSVAAGLTVGTGVAHEQELTQLPAAALAHNWPQESSQQYGSASQTHATQVGESHSAPLCELQQSPPGVGENRGVCGASTHVGVGEAPATSVSVGVGIGPPQLLEHSIPPTSAE